MTERGGFTQIDNAFYSEPYSHDSDYMALWSWLRHFAQFTEEGDDNYQKRKANFGGKSIILKLGQLVTGRKVLAVNSGLDESKVYRILKRLESEQRIEQRTDRQCSLITIRNFRCVEQSEQRNEQGVNNDRTTSEQRVNTIKEVKNDKNDNILSVDESEFYSKFDNYVKECTGSLMENPDNQKKALHSILKNRKNHSGGIMTISDLDSVLRYIVGSKNDTGFKWYGVCISLISLSQRTSKGDQWKVELIHRQSKNKRTSSPGGNRIHQPFEGEL